MAEGRFVSYLRVSTGRQGRSGFALEAQRKTVAAFLNGGAWQLVDEFIEVEVGPGCGSPGAGQGSGAVPVMGATLIVGNVSQLTRNPDFIGRLVEVGVEVRFCDLPKIERLAGRRAISLAKRQEKARRRAADLAPIIAELQASGATSYRQIAAGLNAKGIRTARDGV